MILSAAISALVGLTIGSRLGLFGLMAASTAVAGVGAASIEGNVLAAALLALAATTAFQIASLAAMMLVGSSPDDGPTRLIVTSGTPVAL